MSDVTDDSEDPTAEAPDDQGSLTDDLAKLLTALTAMVGDVQSALNNVAPACETLPACPVCRVTNLIGNCPPEVGQHLMSAAGSVLLAFNAAIEAAKPHEEKQGFEPINLVDDPE